MKRILQHIFILLFMHNLCAAQNHMDPPNEYDKGSLEQKMRKEPEQKQKSPEGQINAPVKNNEGDGIITADKERPKLNKGGEPEKFRQASEKKEGVNFQQPDFRRPPTQTQKRKRGNFKRVDRFT